MELMKKLSCMLLAVLLCVLAAVPAYAADGFVPSITYKDHPELDGPGSLVEGDNTSGEEVKEGCLVITSVADANNSQDIPEDAREELLTVYKLLSEGTMTLPYDGDQEYVIRDLIDVSLICDDGHKESLAQDNVYIELTFELGVAPGVDVSVMVYLDGQWEDVPKVTNNGDGTVTVLFEDLCTVAFSVPAESHTPPAQTGDNSGIGIWLVVMVVSAAALVAMAVMRRRLVR